MNIYIYKNNIKTLYFIFQFLKIKYIKLFKKKKIEKNSLNFILIQTIYLLIECVKKIYKYD